MESSAGGEEKGGGMGQGVWEIEGEIGGEGASKRD